MVQTQHYFPPLLFHPLLGALFKADRHDQILELLNMDPHPIWPYLVWGAKVLAHRGQIDEAIAYLRERAGSTTSETSIARFAEEELLKAGRRAEAFNQYALLANQANTHIATFRGLAKKYPELAKDRLLDHLIASTPGEPGKWFATAKTLKLFDQATRLAWASPCDPKTLNRAARDYLKTQPDFAMQCALASLHWMSMGHGFELLQLQPVVAHEERQSLHVTNRGAQFDVQTQPALRAQQRRTGRARRGLCHGGGAVRHLQLLCQDAWHPHRTQRCGPAAAGGATDAGAGGRHQ